MVNIKIRLCSFKIIRGMGYTTKVLFLLLLFGTVDRGGWSINNRGFACILLQNLRFSDLLLGKIGTWLREI